MLWLECKGPAGSIQEVERQALDAAKRYIQAEDNLFIYAMTTIGVSFRFWYYEKQPADGDWVSPSSLEYQEPSQSDNDGEPSSSTYFHRPRGPTDGGEPSSSTLPYHQASKPSEDAGAAAKSMDDPIDKAVLVKVRREQHTLRPDEYLFKDAKGRTLRSTKKDWTRIKHQGKKVWAYQVKKKLYISDIEIK
ncbi:uncharacterized protein DNG_06316 [Cephalotrichum gorgonifer]|uniref:Uncharacterized protein n=1 Tax=Cephalotrichum gorgonifer TaxID=2041049 RepID=A0AAE8N1C8_9PEZI|nr:uncharacterized protein DNG_06316 [Cephalotrichum gorgonifer]